MVITAANIPAEQKGIYSGMVLSDARAAVPNLDVQDDRPDLAGKLLRRLAEWCIRFTPVVAVDMPDGLLLDVTGCAHLWGGETQYLNVIIRKLTARGYDIRAAMADTIGVAWAMARFGDTSCVVEPGRHIEALLPLPPESLRLEPEAVERLHKLGLRQVSRFIKMPRPSLRRRFGVQFLTRLDQALGRQEETLEPVIPVVPYQERLPCLEPIVTATGIEIALQQLLEALCLRLQQDQQGLRTAILKCYRVDSKIEQIDIGTNRATYHVKHLFQLFALKLSTIEPALGIELFVLEAPRVEDYYAHQEQLWTGGGSLEDVRLSELIDRLAGKLGAQTIHRYLPDEHYWPERSFKQALSISEKPTTTWRNDKQRPLQILAVPEPITVTAPIPDYPPMLFIYRGKRHAIVKADGPERIEQEWWLQEGEHRDYYHVEDEQGSRYWLFRLGHYDDKTYRWFIHGYFS